MKHLIVVIALLIPTMAMAKGECKEDKQKFCKDATDSIACLAQHKAELSEPCRGKLEARANEKKEGSNPTTGGETPKQ